MKILVLGGTKFFGRHLVNDLIANKHDVYVFSRGNVDGQFNGPVTYIKGDRRNSSDLARALKYGSFDVIYDQICWYASDAKKVVDVFEGHVHRFIFTSTGSVYDIHKNNEIFEEDFDYRNFPASVLDPIEYDYQLAKRCAESIYAKSKFPEMVFVRFPIVLGEDDYSGRFKWHIDRIQNNLEIFIPNLSSRSAFVSSKDAGTFLSFLSDKKFTGAINCCASGSILLEDFIKRIEKRVHKKAKLTGEESQENHSPYGFPANFLLQNKKAIELGFNFEDLDMLIDRLIEYYSLP